MAKAFMSKNLKAFAGDDPDAFLRRLHVVDGMDGLDFRYTSLMAYGSSNVIQLVCTYEVRVMRLLNTDFTFTFRQTARTMAWGDGASLVTPRSIWTSMDQMARGRHIVEREREGYIYTRRSPLAEPARSCKFSSPGLSSPLSCRYPLSQ